jgi:hypothetical protein
MKSYTIEIIAAMIIALPFVIYYGFQSIRDFIFPPEDVEYYANLWDCVQGLIFVVLYIVGSIFCLFYLFQGK